MLKRFVSLALLLCAATAAALAEEARIGRVLVEVPPTFSGPVRATPDQKSETVAYSVVAKPGSPTSVLQLTRYDLGTVPALSEEDMAKGTSQYLLEMLQGIERRRTSYVQGEPVSIRLGGVVGARATYSGEIQGVPTNGAMYSLIVAPDVIFLHAFGAGVLPNDDVKAALRAIEALRIEAANQSLEPTLEH